MTKVGDAGTQDASSSPEAKLKAAELEKQMTTMAMVTLRSEFDEYKKRSAIEKQSLIVEKESLSARLKEVLIQGLKHKMQSSDSETEASASLDEEEEEQGTHAEWDDSINQVLLEKRKSLVQQTWKAIQKSLNIESTKLFYKRLFEQYPTTLHLFSAGEIEVQAAKLYQTLSLAVEYLDNLDLLIPKLEELGAKHAISYHVERVLYDAVGECLIWTLKTGLREAWTDDVAGAWGWVYGLVSKTMADAGEKAVTERRKSIVQKTWKDVETTLNVQATKLFYKRLFEVHPTVIPLFSKGNLEVQAAKLFQMLCIAVEALDHMDTLIPQLEDLGARHAIQFQAERAHYDAVGECLLWTLKTCLGRAWTENVDDAWAWVYGIISNTMADAGEKARYGTKLKAKTNKGASAKDNFSSFKIELLEKAMFNLRFQANQTIKELEMENRRLKVQHENFFVTIREILMLKSEASTTESLGKTHEIQEALFSLRHPTDETIWKLEGENRQLTEERETALKNMREVLAMKSQASPSLDAKPSSNSAPRVQT